MRPIAWQRSAEGPVERGAPAWSSSPDVVGTGDERARCWVARNAGSPNSSSPERCASSFPTIMFWSGSTGFSISAGCTRRWPSFYDAEVGRPSVDPEVALRPPPAASQACRRSACAEDRLAATAPRCLSWMTRMALETFACDAGNVGPLPDTGSMDFCTICVHGFGSERCGVVSWRSGAAATSKRSGSTRSEVSYRRRRGPRAATGTTLRSTFICRSRELGFTLDEVHGLLTLIVAARRPRRIRQQGKRQRSRELTYGFQHDGHRAAARPPS
jgi:hypothetical protein